MDYFDRFAVPHPSPAIYASMVAIGLTMIAVVAGITYFKKWGYLWREWLTTVDHKRIGIMYILAALLMLFRGGVDALMMRAQTAIPDNGLLDGQHYNEVFTTHGVVMILFMAMPFIIGLMNIVTPLQIGARDVAFPRLNAVSFWLFFMGAMLFNISFVVGGSPDAGWTSYFPLASNDFSESVGSNYYAISLQIAGIGTLMTGINFIVTILKMRAPGLNLMKMPMFTWSILITNFIIVFAFPVLTVALALMTMDRLFGTQFFTMANGGSDMLWANLFWVWGHPEVYIVILPAFGIYSEIISTFARRNLYGYNSMVISMVAISTLSFIVWAHHFYTMGHGAMVNGIFSITTMAIAVPTGVKIFNWLFTLWKGKIVFTVPMLYSLAFIPIFTLGGVTGVMLAMASADYQYHNTMFLVAHFHYVLIPGTVFAVLAGFTYWWPKMFGFMLSEKIGKWSFWFIIVGFNVTFFPMFITGLDGQARRMYTYSESTGYGPLNMLSFVGAIGLAIGFALIVYNIYWSTRYASRNISNDPWDARSLEWATHTPIPEYNFAIVPTVASTEAFWDAKKKGFKLFGGKVEKIHMPNNSGVPFIMSCIFFVWGFALVFSMWIIAIIATIGIFACMIHRSFEKDHGRYISVEEIEETENKLRGAK
ncbi:cytochrome aa3 quinol oxidase subunit I [Peribacillus frigoritolerans]|jgi:cytochrome aa3-600 menaquinol oxidase subunit I|uniref:cytochrome aa3 quinol oxidase subunit I n=1 Tax=Peribacillus TaxID=2675229 RepID=UPI00070EAFEB|nr:MULTISPECIES: cytochrome aa3 quinol oxidase subunit I [Peribacillus]KRF49985.1 quinol oxidase subunit 1 [Bacillus sp. Soil745]MBD8137993.1 cytochrome aa3 quinol oxidase subunit I [Bacillus sp. CFBP 13597]MBT2603662.1 cytochrome aa3 quinol oxidase subunit I [Bacillus sp. ISL-53]MDP9743109.1 cytochrome aa3-600 menaquinol oxidase subunit 1 [Bacillus sp. B2I3]PAW29894.1 cytochrome aa3 quinol oxidase subunit I [Peribacillus simplex]PEF40389.1 cytochrome aa3 quinol oxidase subunit I [Bacillus sp